MMPRFTENDIRPDALKAQGEALFAADVDDLLRRREEFVPVGCPACESAKHRERFEKAGFRYVTCDVCDTTYMTPRPTPAILEQYYRTSRNYAFWARNIFPASREARSAGIACPRVDALEQFCVEHHVPRSLLVEVGAGDGAFSIEVQRRRLFDRVVVVEPTPSLADTCRRAGLEVLEEPIERVPLDGGISVVASFETIEHLFEPRTFLVRCHRLLVPRGLLYLTCPNVKGFDVALLGRESETFDAEHLNYFHPQSLAILVRRSGFEVIAISTPGELDAELVRKKVLAGTFSLDAQPFLQCVLIERWETTGRAFQDFLSANGLSSHMSAVARKSVA